MKDAPPVPPLQLVIESEGPAHDPTWIRVKALDLTEANAGAKNRQKILDALRTLTPVLAEDTKTLGIPLTGVVEAVGLSDKTVRAHLSLLAQEHAARVVGTLRRPAARGTTRVPLWAALETSA